MPEVFSKNILAQKGLDVRGRVLRFKRVVLEVAIEPKEMG